jgi:hypothetical protein
MGKLANRWGIWGFIRFNLQIIPHMHFFGMTSNSELFLSSYFYYLFFNTNKKYFEIYTPLSDQMSLEISPNLHILRLPKKSG